MEKPTLFARLKGAASNFWTLNRSTYPGYMSSGREQYADRGITLTDEAKVRTDTGYIKAFVSNDFLYKPPYGYPRYLDIPTIRALAKSPYVWQCTSTIIDEIGAIDWDIVPIERSEPDKDESDADIAEDYTAPKIDITQVKRIKEVKEFFNNPNGNDESFNFLIRAAVRDILEIDSGVWVKVFNRAGKMVQLFARDGGTFLKNPDIYGYLGNRAAYVPMPGQFQDEESKKEFYANTVVGSAAYFQYGWVAMMPIPFGRREIVYMMRNSRSDSIYGRSPVEILQDVLQTLIYGNTFNLDYFINNNMPDGVIQLLGANQEQMNAFRERFEQQFKKQDSWGNWRKIFHKFPISNSEVKFTPFALKPQEMGIIEQQQWFSKLVWSCFGVTPSELGYTDSSNRATEMVQSKVFKRKAIRPMLRILEYHINTQIIPEFGYDDIEFKFNDYDVAEDLEKHKLYEVQLRNNIRTVNEVREEIGLHAVEGGDAVGGPESGAFREGGGWRDQFGEEEESDIREGFDMEERSFKSVTDFDKNLINSNRGKVLSPKSNETPSNTKKKFKKDLLQFLRETEKAIMSELSMIYTSDKLAEIKDFTDLWSRLVGKLKGLFSDTRVKPLVDKFTEDFYVKGMDKSEYEFAQNFFPDKKQLTFLKDYNFDLVKGMNQETADRLRSTLQRAHMEQKPFTEVKEEVAKLFHKDRIRAKSIVRTESARAENMGQLAGAKQSGILQVKSLENPMDDRTCALCDRLMKKYGDKGIKLDEKFYDKVTGKSWESPPFHTNCRGHLRTIRKKLMEKN